MRVAPIMCCALLAFAALAPAAEATAHVEVAEIDGVSATFRYEEVPNQSGGESTSGLTLSISHSGSVVYSSNVTSQWCETECDPPFVAPDVHVAVLEPGQEPQVVLDLFTGGAHCCFVEQMFSGPGPNGITKLEHEFGDPRARLEPLGPGGTDVFVSADDRFAYAFTDFADSGLPVQVWALRGGVLTDVTRSYRSLIAADTAKQWGGFKARPRNSVGLFAAWAADEQLLGRGALVRRTLARELRRGRLRAGIGPERGRRFARDLAVDLRRWGYT